MAERLTALVVDGDRENLRLCRMLLEERNYTVFEASSAEAALMLAHGGQHVDVALIAAELGDGVTGLDVRASLERLGIAGKILLMSTVPLDGSDHMLKPISKERLATILF